LNFDSLIPEKQHGYLIPWLKSLWDP
jgi:hypothetical protein